MNDSINVVPTPKGWWRSGENCFIETKICGDFPVPTAAFIEDARRRGFEFSEGEGGICAVFDPDM